MHTDGDINLDFRDVETTMKNGGDAIMAAGRASGEHRVERAIIQALDSPLLYGSDIGRARRILFDIYTSDEEPLYMDEMQEIQDFMQQLDPDIDVIWGTSTDNTLGKDVKVIVLAAGIAGEMQTEGAENKPAIKDDEFFLSLMHQLYETPKAAVRDVIEPELSFEENDEGQKDQEKAEVVETEIEEKAEEKEEAEANQASPQPTFLQRAMQWLSKLTTEES